MTSLFSQIAGNVQTASGNQVYNNHYSRNPIQTNNVTSTATTLTITASVLLNKEADYYVLHIGASQESKTVKKCMFKINERINYVKTKLKQMHIDENDISIDFITQTRIYDHTIEGSTITDYFKGFEVKKNLIIKIKDITVIDEIMTVCSQKEIFDIIKVDYINTQYDITNETLFTETLAQIEAKKNRFLRGSSVKLTGKHRLVSENSKVFYPKNLYKQYNEAFETSTVNVSNYNKYKRINTRKNKTFYYNGIEYDIAIDKIINAISPKIGIQYVMEVTIVYQIDNNSI